MCLSLSLLSDADLIALTLDGTNGAFQVLVDRYHALIRSVVAKYLGGDPMALEDACQEAILRAFDRLADLRNPSRFKSWVCAIARNQALDTIRRRSILISREIRGEDGAVPAWEIPDKKAGPSKLHDRSEVAGIIQDILQEIPDMYRNPITLRYEEDLEYREIAELLGKPLGTVKSLIHRGKLLIKRELTRRAWGSDGAHVLASQ